MNSALSNTNPSDTNLAEKITVAYPETHPGTDRTEISLIRGKPDLKSLFRPGEQNGQKRCFITDATVATLPCMENFISSFEDGVSGGDILIILGSGEAYKTIESVLSIVQTALESDFSRKDLFVGIGGGVITDLAGFSASLFKRGVKVRFVPTTLLSMVDASIGGKTGCDFQNYKNMIGTFYPAQKIDIFPEFVQSLSEEQFRSGLAESLKTALLYDKELYRMFRTEKDKIKSRDEKTVSEIIRRCAKAKSDVVERDFLEHNERAFLNLGHTFGHALETTAGLGAVLHGDAVAWGIGRAAELSAKKEYCAESFKDEVLSVLDDYGWNSSPVPDAVTGGGIGERILNAMRKDKKNLSGKIRLILQKGLCDTFIEEVPDTDILSVLR